MINRFCEFEPRVLEAATRGAWDRGLREHFENCPLCNEVALVAGFMKLETAADLAEAQLPDAELVWWKAQLRARRAAAQKATQPIALVEQAACIGGSLALIAVLGFLWPYVRGWGESIFADWMQGTQIAPVLAIGVLSMFLIGIVSVVFAVGVGIYFAWSDH